MRHWIAICLLCAPCAAAAQTFTTLAFFSDGVTSPSSLVQGRDGGLYGTSSDGGTNGHGTVFKVTPSGVLTTLYNFCSQPNCADGSYAFAQLSLGEDGNFYGTTQSGGTGDLGTVFRITPAGGYTLLHAFRGLDGASPSALVLASDGNFYGTTSGGGSHDGTGGGTIFKSTSAGTLSTLHAFNRSSGAGGEPGCPYPRQGRKPVRNNGWRRDSYLRVYLPRIRRVRNRVQDHVARDIHQPSQLRPL